MENNKNLYFQVVGGWRPVVGYAYGLWSVVFMVGAIGGRCFMFLMVGGRLFFSTMVGGRCSIQYLVGGRWHKVCGRWSVVGGWSVVLYYALPYRVRLGNGAIFEKAMVIGMTWSDGSWDTILTFFGLVQEIYAKNYKL